MLRHGSSLSRVGASGKPGAVHGTPAGAFRLLPPVPLGTVAPGVEAAPTAVVMAPLTGQTTPDLAVTHLVADSPGFVTLWRRDAQGDLTRLGDAIAVGTGPTALVAGDLDGDGRLDLVVANQSDGQNDGTVTVLMNRGGGAFEPAGPALRAGAEPVALALADFDAAGRLDLAVLDRTNSTVLVFRNQGNGHFNPVPAPSLPDRRRIHGCPSFSHCYAPQPDKAPTPSAFVETVPRSC